MESSELLSTLRRDPSLLSDHELLFLDYAIHHAWRSLHDGGPVYFPPCNAEQLVELHALIRGEMTRRGFQHLIADELDTRSSTLEQQRRVIEVGLVRQVMRGGLPESGGYDE